MRLIRAKQSLSSLCLLVAFLGFCAVLLPQKAAAQSCSFAIGDMNFGPINPTSNSPYASTATLSGSCTGTAGSVVRLCASLGDGQYGSNGAGSPRLLSNGTSQLKFSFYTNAAQSVVWGSYVWPWTATFPGTQIDIPIGTTGNGSLNTVIYGGVLAGQTNVTTGNYLSAFTSGHTLFQYGYATLGTCAAGQVNTATTQPTFNVLAAYPAYCSLSASDLVFPTTAHLTSNVDGETALSVTCSNASPYTIALSLGNGTGVTGPADRRMMAGSDYVIYGLYQDAGRSSIWGGNLGFDTYSGSGTGTNQFIPVYGRVPVQTTPRPATYVDNIVATITY